jgi:hypothetical protein
MTFQLRRGMISEEGAGWAVTDWQGFPLPGRWADEATAREQGLLGVYLLSGHDVKEVVPQPERFTTPGYDGPEGTEWRERPWSE